MLDNEIDIPSQYNRPMDPSEIPSFTQEDEYSSISERDLDQMMLSATPSPTLNQPAHDATMEELRLDAIPPAAAAVPAPVTCPICSKEFASKRSLAAHKRVHEASGGAAEKSFECSLCSRKFARSSNLKKHMQQIHPETQPQTQPDVVSDPTPSVFEADPQVSFSDFTFDKPQLLGEHGHAPVLDSDHDENMTEDHPTTSIQTPNLQEELIRLRAQNELLSNLLSSQMNQMFTFFSKK